MRTIVTDADYLTIAALAGVKWRDPTAECLVRFGVFQGSLVGIEACGKLWAVHCDDDATRKALVSFLDGCTVFGAETWAAVVGTGVPHIGGGTVEELIDGAKAVKVDKGGKATALDAAAAETSLSAARAVGPKDIGDDAEAVPK